MAGANNDGFVYLLHPARAIVLLECRAPSSSEQLTRSIRRVLADPAYRGEFAWIADMRSITAAPDAESVRASVAAIHASLGTCSARRWVRVVDRREPSIYGCARMADAVMENIGWDSFCCGTLEEAFAWCEERRTGATSPLTIREWPSRRVTAVGSEPVPDIAPRPTPPIPDRRRPVHS
jgi:hypothetical protein